MSVILRFSTTKSLLSWAIRTRLWSPYSHVDFVIGDDLYLGAIPFQEVKVHTKKFPVEDFFKLEVTNDQGRLILENAWRHLGKPYDLWGAFSFAAAKDWQDKDKWFCSEYVAGCIQPVVPLFNETPSKISPRDLSIHTLMKKL